MFPNKIPGLIEIIIGGAILICFSSHSAARNSGKIDIWGITGQIRNLKIAVPAPQKISPADTTPRPTDIDLKRMADWAMNYLIQTPRKELNYEPVFQCFPLECPPIPEGQDPVVACDTEARMDWEWYYMRDISGSKKGKAVEAAFHKRMRDYIEPDGRVWSAPGCYNEGDIHAKYDKKDYVNHIWGSTKILKSLSEDYIRTKSPESKALARKVMLALKKIATWDDKGRCWIACGGGGDKAGWLHNSPWMECTSRAPRRSVGDVLAGDGRCRRAGVCPGLCGGDY